MSICAAVNDAAQVKKYPNILGPIANDSWKNDLVCCACGPNVPGDVIIKILVIAVLLLAKQL